jgi:hypothetical protein
LREATECHRLPFVAADLDPKTPVHYARSFSRSSSMASARQ